MLFRKKSFIQRTISTVFLTLFAVWIFFYSGKIIYSIAIILIASLALKEFYKILEIKYGKIYPGVGFFASYILFLSVLHIGLNQSYFIYILSFSVTGLFFYQFLHKTNQNAALCLGLTILGLIYITVPFLFILRTFLDLGPAVLAYFIFVTKSADVGAYLAGSVIGRHPLIPRISPKKSVEGFFGGIFFSLLAAYAGARFMPFLSLIHIAVIGIILGLFGQFGDLAESVIKRDSGVKDAGRIIPGMGGVLDLMDSLLIAIPFYYLYLKIFIFR